MVYLIVIFFALVLLFLLYFLNFFIRVKVFDGLKLGSFESGFASVGKVQNSFSIHFFIIMLIFIIFDLEVVLFLGLLISDFSSFLSFFLLIFFILGGFYMEWYMGKLIWLI